jgi:hypothetical protein
MECDNAGFFEAMGSGGCGCDMTGSLTGRGQFLDYLVMALLFVVPMAAIRWIRSR